MNSGEQTTLILFVILSALGLVASLYLWYQAKVDDRVRIALKRNGPLRTVARAHIWEEAKDSIVNGSIVFSLASSFFFSSSEYLVIRRLPLTAATVIITTSSWRRLYVRRKLMEELHALQKLEEKKGQ